MKRVCRCALYERGQGEGSSHVMPALEDGKAAFYSSDRQMGSSKQSCATTGWPLWPFSLTVQTVRVGQSTATLSATTITITQWHTGLTVLLHCSALKLH